MRKKFFKIIAFLIGICLIISLSRSIYQLLEAGKQLGKAEDRLVQLTEERKQLFEQKKSQESRFFIEKEASQKLNLTYPNEALVILPDEIKQAGDVENLWAEPIPNYRRWLNLFI